MIEFLLINKVLVFLINAIALWLAFLVYYNNPKAKINKLFILMTASMLFWVNFAYFARFVGQNQIYQSLLFIKIAWFVTPLLFLFLSLVAVYIIQEEKKYWLLNKMVLFLGMTIAFITGFTNLVIEGIKFENGNLVVFYGKGMLPFLGTVMFLMCATLYPLFKKYFKSLKEEKKKIEFFLIGIVLFYLANIIFNIALPIKFNVSQYYYIGDYSTIFLLGFTAYAIVKHELFGIKVVLTTLFVVLIGILLTLDALIFTPELSIQLFKGLILIFFLYFGYLLVKSVLEEIKRRKELERVTLQLEKANKELEKLNKSKTEFISMASHQLRTPLTAIKGYSSLMLQGTYGKLEEREKKVLKNIFTSSERLIKIVNDLLSISKIELRKVVLEKEPTRIGKIVESVYQEMKPRAQKRGIKLIWQKPKKPLPEINIDALKIRQAIFNLIDNAIKYTEKGYVSITANYIFQAPNHKDEGKIIIEIKDTGRGFTKEEKNRVFELFVRGQAGRDAFVEGTGIGLNVARKFVELHGGKIRAQSEGRNKGATFYIELPVK
ncbi:MAG: ATP-binding protein [Minisyncoccales bacterium]